MSILRVLCNNLSKTTKNFVSIQSSRVRYFGKNLKVTLCGAAGNVGQPLSLILKQSPYIDELALYDLEKTTGLALELGHIDTKCKVTSYTQPTCFEAFQDASVVILSAGSPSGSLQEYERMFDSNAIIVKELMSYGAEYCPKALFAIATNPIDGMVPLAAEVFKIKNCYDPSKQFGITTLDVIRANTLVAEALDIEPECVMVPVVGGHVEQSIIPVLSQAKPCPELSEDEIQCITHNVQQAHKNIIKIKTNEGATLSTAFAIARFVISLIKGLKGHADIIECTFIRTDSNPQTNYFAVPVLLGPNGVQKVFGVPELSNYEKCLMQHAVPLLNKYEERAKSFLGIQDKEPCDICSPDPNAPPCPEDTCRRMPDI